MLSLLIGCPGSGKTTLAVRAARHARRSGTAVLVLDPRGDPRWPPGIESFTSPEDLRRVAVALAPDGSPGTVGCLVVVDEATWLAREYADLIAALSTQHRHHGHSVLVLAHRYTSVPTIARTCADRLYLFQVGADDAKTASRDRGRAGLLRAPDLALGVALVADRASSEVREHRVFGAG